MFFFSPQITVVLSVNANKEFKLSCMNHRFELKMLRTCLIFCSYLELENKQRKIVLTS